MQWNDWWTICRRAHFLLWRDVCVFGFEFGLTFKVSGVAAYLFVDTFGGFGCIQRLSNAHRCLIEMARSTFWYMRITINLCERERLGVDHGHFPWELWGGWHLPLCPPVCVDCCNRFSALIWCHMTHIWSSPHGRTWNLSAARRDPPGRRFRCIANTSIRRNLVDTSSRRPFLLCSLFLPISMENCFNCNYTHHYTHTHAHTPSTTTVLLLSVGCRALNQNESFIPLRIVLISFSLVFFLVFCDWLFSLFCCCHSINRQHMSMHTRTLYNDHDTTTHFCQFLKWKRIQYI